jgi:hypothetical protein
MAVAIKIAVERNVARTYFPEVVLYHSVYGNVVKLHQLLSYGQQTEHLLADGGFADTIVQKHIELQMFLLANPYKIGYIHLFDKGKHWIWSVFPNLKLLGSACFLRIYFFHAFYSLGS